MSIQRFALLGMFMFVFLPSFSQAQFIDQGFGGGMTIGGTIGNTELNNSEVDFLVRGFVRQGFASHLVGELGIGSGNVRGKDSKTHILPIDLRLLYSPFDLESWNTYLYAGIGGAKYQHYTTTGSSTLHKGDDGWLGVVPLGLGFQFLMEDWVAFEVTGGYNYCLSDNLNAVEEGENDAYWSFSIGLARIGGDVDSDGDGLSDDAEKKYGTDPANPDTDDDGLHDGAEVYDYGTDPLKEDTDTGSVGDGVEVQRGTDPLNPEDDVRHETVVIGVPIVLEGITFESESAKIQPESKNALQKTFNTLYFNPDIDVEIHGHSDSTGNRDFNMQLSLDRANAVRDWLIKKGIAPERLVAKGFGPDQPKATNTTPEGREQNRRIEFIRMK